MPWEGNKKKFINDIVQYKNKTTDRPQQKDYLQNKKGRVLHIINDIGQETIYCIEFKGRNGVWFCSREVLKIILLAAA